MALSWGELLGVVVASVLIFEGMMPLLFTRQWRQALGEALRLNDGQLRFFGLAAFLAGALLATLVLL